MLLSLQIVFLTTVKYTGSEKVFDAGMVINSCDGFFFALAFVTYGA